MNFKLKGRLRAVQNTESSKTENFGADLAVTFGAAQGHFTVFLDIWPCIATATMNSRKATNKTRKMIRVSVRLDLSMESSPFCSFTCTSPMIRWADNFGLLTSCCTSNITLIFLIIIELIIVELIIVEFDPSFSSQDSQPPLMLQPELLSGLFWPVSSELSFFFTGAYK